MSDSAKRLDLFTQQLWKGLFKAKGFRKSGRTFRRQIGQDWQILNLQGSLRNNAEECRFAVNLAIYIDVIASCAGRRYEDPKESQGTLRARLEEVAPSVPDWWTIQPGPNTTALAADLTGAVESFALPWLDRNLALEVACQSLSGQFSRESIASALVLGRNEEALRRLKHIVETRPRASENFLGWARERGLVDKRGLE